MNYDLVMTTYNKFSISLAIAQIRKDKGFSQQEMALFLKISQSKMSKIEKGKLDISLVEFLLFCKKLKIGPVGLIRKIEKNF